MKIKSIFTIGFLSILFLLPLTRVNANSLSPAITQTMLSSGDTFDSKILFTNTTNKTVYILPTVAGYNPKTSSILVKDTYFFVKTDTETFKVESGATISLSYKIVVPPNLPLGTYFNLIILKQTNDAGFLNPQNSVGAVDNLSHLVVLHIVQQGDVKGITSEFAQISMEIVQRGIPFIKDAKVKYIYQNITNYVLIPDGEIQVYNNKGKYAPQYYKINKDRQKLYPNDIIEETIVIDKWHISDLIYPRTVLGLFYNGIDENNISKEIEQNSSYFFVLSGAIILMLGFAFFKSLKQGKRKSKA